MKRRLFRVQSVLTLEHEMNLKNENQKMGRIEYRVIYCAFG